MSYGLLNQYAKQNNIVFHTTVAVFIQNVLKIVIALCMYQNEEQKSIAHGISSIFNKHMQFFGYYLIPSACYVIYDVLSYINLKRLDPASYFLLLQFRMVITAIIHQLFFNSKLNRNQWLALLITTAGCMSKTIGDHFINDAQHRKHSVDYTVYILVLLQIVASTFAGVYNEALLKNKKQLSMHLQNVVMYMDSLMVLLLTRSIGILPGQPIVLPDDVLHIITTPSLCSMVVLISCVGIVTSLFLKALDSIKKALASALELVCLPFLSFIFFHTPISFHLMISIGFVSYGVYLYALPVIPSSQQHVRKKAQVV